MTYNGYPSQDAFHEAMQAAWKERLSTPEGRAQHAKDYGPGNTSHAACDHANDYCCQTETNTFIPQED